MATGKNGFQYRLLGIRNDINQEKVFENFICVSLSEQAQMVGDKILAAKKAKKKKVDK